MSDLIDFSFPAPRMVLPSGAGTRAFWDAFFAEKAHAIFRAGGFIVDIGGGMRLDASRGDRADPSRQREFGSYLHDSRVSFKITDYTDQYHPDLVEDIHHLSFADASVDGLFCMAVLEHVFDPKTAAEEIVRVLRPGGKALLYVPFIYRYHANVTEDYRDYYRYSKDGIGYLFRSCSSNEICPVRGIFESLLRFTPLHTWPALPKLARFVDWSSKSLRTLSSRQASGYFIALTK